MSTKPNTETSNKTTPENPPGLVYSVPMDARDHECDIQGVVNNAHYQHYFEHARHRFLLENDIDFSALAQQNINLMVSKIEIEYLGSIVAHDQFYVTVKVMTESKVRYQFVQEIHKQNNDELLAIAKTTVVTVGDNKKLLRKSPLQKLIN
ncbi:MAG: acyl-CoA thioesterase [Thiomicrorhabdus sp.]|jgi:acyl-CoA thioester hydrolase|nr:acyl-CoA thioesterase [Thiomicrorhabdus sp.]